MLEPYLKSQGIAWIDYAVVSHGDKDFDKDYVKAVARQAGIEIEWK